MTIDITTATVAAMLEGVTGGPWAVDGPLWNQIIWSSAENRVAFMAHSNGLNDDRDIATARFIAYAREAVPALSAERDALESDVTTYQAIVKDMTVERDALADKLAEVTASIRWVNEVYPARIEAGGAGVEITWSEFNAMQKAIGAREDRRIGDQEGRASHNHRLRVARNEALARAEAAEARNDALTAEVERLRGAALALQKDMMQRAEMRIDGISGDQYRIVNAGCTAWDDFCAAL